MKKTIALFFIFFANIILLAHAALPHHHHGEEVCITISHFHTSPGGTTFPVDCTHEHDTESPLTNCTLKQLIVVPAVQDKIEPAFFYLDNFTESWIFKAEFSGDDQFTELFRTNSHPRDVLLFHHFIDHAKGLRAPPAI